MREKESVSIYLEESDNSFEEDMEFIHKELEDMQVEETA